MAIGEEYVADAQDFIVTGKVRADRIPEGLLAFAFEDDNIMVCGVIALKEPAGTGVCGDRSASLGENGGCGIVGHHHTGLVLMQPSPEEQLLRLFADLSKPLRASSCPCTALVTQSLIVITVLAERLVPSINRLDGDFTELLIDFGEEMPCPVRELEGG